MNPVHVRAAALTLGAAVLIGLVPFTAALGAPGAPTAVSDETPPPKDPEVLPELVTGDEPQKRDEAPQPVVAPLAAGNDAYANAFSLSGIVLTEPGTLVDSTLEAHEPTRLAAAFTSFVTHSVWYKWKAPATGSITVDTYYSDNEDTTLAIFTGSTMASAKRLAVNDDEQGLGNDGVLPAYRSRIVSFPVKKGSTYHIQVGSQGSSTPDDFVLNIRGVFSPPSNDNKGQAISKTGHSSWSDTKSDFGATIEPIWEPVDNPSFPGFNRAGSVWYKWTPPAAGTITVDTNDSVGDSYLAVFGAIPTGTLAQAGFNDEGGDTLNDAKLSGLTVYANYDYFIQVGHVSSTADWYPGTLKVHFSYTATGPAISKISPSSGPLSGGTKITITGVRLTGTSAVTVDGVNATGVTVVSPTKVTAFVPAGASTGKKYVMVTAAGAISRVNSTTAFTYK